MNLDKCPMCGKTYALIIQTWRELLAFHDLECEYDTEWYQVVCSANKGGCGTSARYAKTPEEAAAHWNTRHEARKTISMIEYDAPQRFYIDAQVDGVSIGQLSGGKDDQGIRDDAIKILKKLGFRWE